jgi:hypothetical protein
MRLRAALIALILLFPALYISSVVLRSDVASAVVLSLVVLLCAWLLLPEGGQ